MFVTLVLALVFVFVFVFLWVTCTITRTRRQGLQVFVSLGLNSFFKGKESKRAEDIFFQFSLTDKFFFFRLSSFYSMVYWKRKWMTWYNYCLHVVFRGMVLWAHMEIWKRSEFRSIYIGIWRNYSSYWEALKSHRLDIRFQKKLWRLISLHR